MNSISVVAKCLVFLALLLACSGALAQEAYVIEADGMATVDATPDSIVFELEVLPQGSSHAELLQKADEFEAKVRKEIEDKALTPSQMVFSGLNYTHPAKLGPNATAQLRFPVGAYVAGEDAPAKLAALHDVITALAMTTGARFSNITYPVSDPEPVEAAAIARAVEKAYPTAKAAADVMNARILTVADVRVLEVVWSTQDSPPADYNIRRVTCTARIHVGYLYVPNV